LSKEDTTPDARPEQTHWWVIEDASADISMPRYWGGRHGWTTDYLKAIRFCREEDAQSQLETIAAPTSSGLWVIRCQWTD
jgi:hypothetical protein